jgi:hypothetical protein
MKINFEQLAASMDMTIEQYTEYLYASNQALRLELAKAKSTIEEISEISTRKALDLKVVLSDPNFFKPIDKLNKIY